MSESKEKSNLSIKIATLSSVFAIAASIGAGVKYIRDSSIEIGRLQAALEEKNARLDDYRTEINRLRNNLDQNTAKLAAKENEAFSSQLEINGLRKRNTLLERDLEEREEETLRLNNLLNSEKKCEPIRVAISKLESSLAQNDVFAPSTERRIEIQKQIEYKEHQLSECVLKY